MKPNDENGKLPTSERPFRVLIISGSDRRQYNCPGVDSKSRALMLRMAERLPQEWLIDYEDLGNVYARARIQSCNACVSTSMALCVWPCLPASERVLGRRVRGIAELKSGYEISTGRVTRAWMSSPRAEVFRLKLSDGRQVRLTANHPVKVIREVRREKVGREWKYVWKEEWVEASKLEPGDKVPFPLGRECGEFAAGSGVEEFYCLLAGLVFGDGAFAGAGQVRLFFDKRKPALAEAAAALSPVKVDVRKQVFSSKANGWPAGAAQFMYYDCWDVSVGRVLREKLGLDKSAPVAERHIPRAILDGSEREACAFLRGWFSADGSVDFHTTKARVSLSSSSVRALREAQILLAKLGIRSCVYDVSHKRVSVGGREYARSSTLQIAKAESVERFGELVGFIDDKVERLCAILRRPGRDLKRRWPAGANRNYGRVVSLEPDGFFCYGDGGGDELGEDGRPRLLRHKEYFNPEGEPFDNERDTYAPLVWQCRYSGVEVPDQLWRYLQFGEGRKYSDNQAEHMPSETNVFEKFDEWVDDFARFVGGKGKVEPGRYRAYGYEAPGHLGADIKAKFRELRTGLGFPPEGSSPAKQEGLGLNEDLTLRPKKGEGEKLREE